MAIVYFDVTYGGNCYRIMRGDTCLSSVQRNSFHSYSNGDDDVYLPLEVHFPTNYAIATVNDQSFFEARALLTHQTRTWGWFFCSNFVRALQWQRVVTMWFLQRPKNQCEIWHQSDLSSMPILQSYWVCVVFKVQSFQMSHIPKLQWWGRIVFLSLSSLCSLFRMLT